jgi:hypothetical protein
MTISDAYVDVVCDQCQVIKKQVRLSATAGGGWDQRTIEDKLVRVGWLVKGDKHYCENCRKHHELKEETAGPEDLTDPRR